MVAEIIIVGWRIGTSRWVKKRKLFFFELGRLVQGTCEHFRAGWLAAATADFAIAVLVAEVPEATAGHLAGAQALIGRYLLLRVRDGIRGFVSLMEQKWKLEF